MRAIRVVSIERGHDPRAFTLMPFGGAGALHAVEIARELGIRSILVPPAPGILCAEGVAASELEESFVASCRVPLDGDLAARRGGFRPAAGSGPAVAGERQREADSRRRRTAAIDMRYVGQNFELAIPLPPGDGVPEAHWLGRAFLEAHQRKYGHHDPTAAIEIINVRLTARKGRARSARGWRPRERGAGMPKPDRDGGRSGSPRDAPTETPFIAREALAPGAVLEGPLVVTQFDATTLVPPGSRLAVEPSGGLLIEVEP